MRKLGLVRSWMSWCAGVCLIVGACSSNEDDGSEASGGTDAVGGAATGGKGGSGADAGGDGGTAGEGTGGTGRAGSGGSGAGNGGGGQGGACDEEVVNGLIRRTLAEYCERNDCPLTLERARRNVLECSTYEYSEETTGCGYKVVSFYGEYSQRGFVFDAGTLVGAYSSSDEVEPRCESWGEFGGIYPSPCPGADGCRICDREDGAGGEGPFCDFDGGAGGEVGFGGQGGRL